MGHCFLIINLIPRYLKRAPILFLIQHIMWFCGRAVYCGTKIDVGLTHSPSTIILLDCYYCIIILCDEEVHVLFDPALMNTLMSRQSPKKKDSFSHLKIHILCDEYMCCVIPHDVTPIQKKRSINSIISENSHQNSSLATAS